MSLLATPSPRSVAAGSRYAVAIAAVAVGSAAFSVGFRVLLAVVYERLFRAPSVVAAIAGVPWWARIAIPVTGGLMAGAVALIRGHARQDVSNVMEAVALGHVRLSLRTTLRRVTSSWIAIAAGLSIGREGPLIEFGGTLGATVGRAARIPQRWTRTLVAAGTAAGFGAAYNTPFAAALFVLETIVGIAALEAVIPILAATAIGTALTRAMAGGGPIYGARDFVTTSPWEIGSFVAVAALAACAAVVFKQCLAWFEGAFTRWPVGQPWRSAVGGLLVGAIASGVPHVAGNGYEPLNQLLDGTMDVRLLLLLLVAKMVATSASVASGVPGGVFTPVLLVGGLVGAGWGHFVGLAWHVPATHVGSYVLLGMAAATAASTHAPLTAAVLVFELSGDYAIALPLLFVTPLATLLSRALGTVSVYEAELRRRGVAWRLTLEGRHVAKGPP